ncbi:MAG TPA: hypothetical protein VI387_03205, partial [Candidatus Brocadiales bacterium]|nr:hypothetical protein [Candidatus Brocadiales bacterium]
MQLKSNVFCIGLILFIISHSPCLAQESWRFKQIYESERLTVYPFLLMATGDVNGNKIKEIVVADFGRFG